jgi:hypothetical protein
MNAGKATVRMLYEEDLGAAASGAAAVPVRDRSFKGR